MEKPDNFQEEKLLPSDSTSESHNGNSKYAILATSISAFGAFTVGYDVGIISGSMVLITEEFSLSYLWQELLVSFAIGPAIIGALFGGYLNERIGRKSTLLVSSAIFSIGAFVMGFAPSKEILLVGRIVTGVAIGFSCVSTNLYISESAPCNVRGRLITIGSLFITGSEFVAAIISGIFSKNKHTGWRYMLGLGAVPSLVLFIGMLMVPESPRWLIGKGRIKEATEVLQKLRGSHDVEHEISDIKKQHEISKQEGNTWSILFRMLKLSSMRKALLVACGLMAFQQLSSINTVMYYTATIIKMAGVKDDKKAIWLAAAVAFANFFFTFLGFFFVERIGRRKLVLTSMCGVCFSLLVLMFAFHLQVEYSPAVTNSHLLVTMDSHMAHSRNPCLLAKTCHECLTNHMCGFCYLGDEKSIQNSSCVALSNSLNSCDLQQNFQLIRKACPSSIAWLAVLGMVLYLACFSPGLGPVPFVVTSEIFPLWARPTGIACAIATAHFFNLSVSMTFLHGTKLLTTSGWFGLSAGFCALGWLFVYFVLPETGGIRLEHMHGLFESNGSE